MYRYTGTYVLCALYVTRPHPYMCTRIILTGYVVSVRSPRVDVKFILVGN